MRRSNPMFAALAASLVLASAVVSAQYTSQPQAGCVAGRDCVGLQLGAFVGPSAQSIPCDSGFAGYLCGVEHPAVSHSFSECPSGFFCKDAVTIEPCPSGFWCPNSHTQPTKCYAGSTCPEESYKQRFFTPLIALLGTCAFIILAFFVSRRMANQRAAARLANLAAQPQAHAIKVKGLRGKDSAGPSFPAHPKININIEHLGVTVKGSAAASGAAAASASPTSPSAQGLLDASSPSASPAAATVDAVIGVTGKRGSLAMGPAGNLSNPVTGGASGGNKSSITILNDISGRIRGGRLTAIIGPSGSGKTTFLSALLGKVPVSSGRIQINYQYSVSEMIAMNIVGFVPQSDVMLPMMTVRDLLVHSAYMRLPGSMSDAQKLLRVDAVMELLGIAHIADSFVGDDAARGVSGGEKKRCSIAMELVADPLILMLDEPTSGLDSAAAMQVCNGLRAIALQQRVVACVIHQPRYEIFAAFDDILLLGKGGHRIYFGPVVGLKRFFAAMGFFVPPHCNPADFYMDVISAPGFMDKWISGGEEMLKAEARANGACPPEVHDEDTPEAEPVEAHNAHASASGVVRVHLAPAESGVGGVSQVSHHAGSSQQQDGQQGGIEMATIERTAAAGGEHDEKEVAVASTSSAAIAAATVDEAAAADDKTMALGRLNTFSSHTPITPIIPASFLSQIRYLFYRAFLQDWRDATLVVLDSFLQVLPAVSLAINSLDRDEYSAPLPKAVADTCFGMIYDRCQEQVLLPQALTTPGFFYTMIIGVGAMIGASGTFGLRQSVFHRDRTAGMNVTSYFLARACYDLLHLLRMTLIFLSLFYLMSSPRGDWGSWFAVVLALFWAGQGVSYVVSILVPHHRGSNTIAIVLAVCFSVTSGLLPTLKVVEGWGPLRVFWYLSYNRWGAEALTILAAAGSDTAGRMDVALTAVGYNPDNFAIDVGMIVLLGVMWRGVAYIALRRSKPSASF